MKPHIESIQDKLAEVDQLNYTDEDWGQLDDFSPNFPVQWPCALIDVGAAQYTNIGGTGQMGLYTVVVKYANLRLTNSSGRAPQQQQDNAFSIWDLIEDGHKVLRGHRPADNATGLIRTGMRRTKRDDGVQQYEVLYSYECSDV